MIAIKTSLKELPENCYYCQWHTCRPHPFKGWLEADDIIAKMEGKADA